LAAALDPVADDVVEVEGRQGEVVVGLTGVPDRSIGSPLGGVAVSPNGNTVYVANDGSDSVSVIDTGT
jgi:DNA-binding beta-propeller fold protein YncE